MRFLDQTILPQFSDGVAGGVPDSRRIQLLGYGVDMYVERVVVPANLSKLVILRFVCGVHCLSSTARFTHIYLYIFLTLYLKPGTRILAQPFFSTQLLPSYHLTPSKHEHHLKHHVNDRRHLLLPRPQQERCGKLHETPCKSRA